MNVKNSLNYLMQVLKIHSVHFIQRTKLILIVADMIMLEIRILVNA